MDLQLYSCPGPHKCLCLVVISCLAQTSYITSSGLFLYQKNGFNGNCLIRAGEEMKSIHVKGLAEGQALSKQELSSSCFLLWLSSSQAFPYDFQTGPFCRISTLLFPSYPHQERTSLLFPPNQIVPLLQLW